MTKPLAFELIASLYQQAFEMHGDNWACVEAEVRAQLGALDPALRLDINNELSMMALAPDGAPPPAAPH
jgi:hypothetical protein